MATIHIPLNARCTHPFPQYHQVSFHDSTNSKSRISSPNSSPRVDRAPQVQCLGYNSLSTNSLDLKTCEVKRHIICLVHTSLHYRHNCYKHHHFKRETQGTHRSYWFIAILKSSQACVATRSLFRAWTHCHLFISVLTWILFHPVGYNPFFWSFVLMINLVQSWPVEETSSSCAFGFVLIIFQTFPCFLAQDVPGLYLSCLNPGIGHSAGSQGPPWLFDTLFSSVSHFPLSSLYIYPEWPNLFSRPLDLYLHPHQLF